MKRLFLDDFYSSFAMWFDHILLVNGQAYSNQGLSLMSQNDKNLQGYKVFGTEYKQWVYDQSVTGANIPSGVYVNNTFVPRGVSGLKIDYQQGRAIFTGGNSNWHVSGNFAAKDFNIYTTTKSDQEIIFNTNFIVSPTTQEMATGDFSNQAVAPCVFLKIKGMENSPFEFGGMDNSVVTARAIIISDSESEMQGVGNLFADTCRSSFCLLGIPPLNRFGDTKSGEYNYNTDVQQNFATNRLIYVSRASFSKMTKEALQNRIGDKYPDMYIGFIDFKFELPRITRL